MNPQYSGQYGQGPPQGYNGPPQRPPGPGMYNGQHMQGPGAIGQPPKTGPVHNGPQPGPPGNLGPQGDVQRFGAPRPGAPFPPGGQMPPGGQGPNKAGQMGPGPAPNMMTSQMGNMSISGQPRGPAPMGGNPPASMSGGYGGVPPGKGPGPNMGQPGGMQPPGQPNNMAGPPQSQTGMGGPPFSQAQGMGGQPTSQPPQPGMPMSRPQMSPPGMPGGPQYSQPGMNAPRPPTSHPNAGLPPSSMPSAPGGFNQPPSQGQFSPPASSGYGQAPSSTGYSPGSLPTSSGYGPPMGSTPGQQPGFPPPVASSSMPPMPGAGGPRPPMAGAPYNPANPPLPHAPMGAQPPHAPTSTGYGQQPGYGAPPPMGMDRQTPTSFAGPSQPGMPPQPGYGGPPSGPSGQGGFPPPGGAPPGMGQQPYPGGAPPGPGQFNQGFPGQNQPGGMPQRQPQQKLDPDQMPSPVQVIEDDRRNRSGVFSTAGKGTVPPLVTTQFITQDQGNCNPAFLRSTMYNVPCTADLLKNSHIPFSLTISPFAKLQQEEGMPPIVNLGELGPVRCKRCKAYMNPYMLFIDGGRRFQCVFCGASTDVPNEYFAHLDHTGRRVDSYDRPELCLGSYEFVATKDYCKNSVVPKEPAFIFMIDVSYNAVKSGLVQLICDRLKNDILVNLPKDTGATESEIRVGFVTYSKEIHFYNVKSNLAQPQMLVVSDLEDMFVPLLDGFLVKLSESEAVIDSLLAQIPTMFAESRETEVVLGPVIQAGLDALRSADRTGKLYIFHTSLPIGEAPGKLKNRDDRKLLGTDKEKTILTAQTKFYSQLGQECVAAGCSVDLFLFPNSYCDVATISDVCRLTSGNLYKYSYFQRQPTGDLAADLDGDRFIQDLKTNIESQRAFDAIVRVRTSQGIRPVDFLGNFYMANTTDVEMCAIDSNQAIAVEIKHDDKLSEQDGAYVQVAVLFTSVSGQRRLRIHNQSLNCCTQLADLFRNCELDTLINYLSKYAIRNTLNKTPRETREHIMTETANILACYRKNCASPSSAGQLILPECMKLLPLYSNCVIKSDGIQGGQEISTDDRSYLMHLINGMDVKTSCAFFYPRLIPLHNLDPDTPNLPTAMRCSADRLMDNGVYLLENGISMFMWIGFNVDPQWIQNTFSVQSAAQIDIDKCRLLELENETSHRVREAVNQVRAHRNRYMKLTIVRQRDKLEPWFNHFLVEDKGQNGSASYVDFLCHIHKEIRSLLN